MTLIARAKNRFFSCFIVFIIPFSSCTDNSGKDAGGKNKSETVDFQKLREAMVETQIIARGIKDESVISAMLRVACFS